jgi:molecular chaperone GrpE
MTEPQTPPDATATQETDGAGTDNQQGATDVLQDLEKLRAQVQTAEEERATFKDLLQRTRADFENYQKRMQRDLAQERRYAQAPLAKDLLPALDNLNRALAAAKQVGESGPLVQGVNMVQTQILDVLRRHGITPIEAQGKPFDPNLHQAVMQTPTMAVPPQTVVQVVEQGFMIHDRVLRPASVVVAAPVEASQS